MDEIIFKVILILFLGLLVKLVYEPGIVSEGKEYTTKRKIFSWSMILIGSLYLICFVVKSLIITVIIGPFVPSKMPKDL